MSNVAVIKHPLIEHKLTLMRMKDTSSKDFRELLTEITMLMCYEATKDLDLCEIEIETPLKKMKAEVLSGKKLALIPILRAGVGMVEAFTNIIPSARVGHIGLYRDPETSEPFEYYSKLPEDLEKRTIFVLDPMLATGGSAAAAIEILKKRGATDIKMVNLVASPEGVEYIQKLHPDVDMYIASIDEGLDDHNYIVPGLGDAGDRLFGTK
ncbi:uracil phosphoribosyltransferase [Peptostreptococcus faecalis]|uniref:uracil phosphoribosyltransferase n=1 Tax=Peptostreptococcus faecalis TaxID=2045015 RepID=UPI000C7C1560|nr:uracil phosphoribosyltransferase [Peptostreptococcus faecalis]